MRVSVLLVPVLPSILPSILPPSLKTKASLSVPPVRFWILLNAREFSVPPLLAVRFQLLLALLPVRLLLPVPPSIAVTVPPLRIKLSVLLPPVKFWKVSKLKVPLILLILPLLSLVTFQVLAAFSPIKVLLAVVPPFAASMLVIVPPTAVAVLFPKSTVTGLL